MNKVVVTGIGLVTPLGAGREKTWKALIAGDSGIVSAPEDLGVGAFAPVRDDVPEKHCRPVNLALLAANEAWSDAGLNNDWHAPERIGCSVSMSKPFLKTEFRVTPELKVYNLGFNTDVASTLAKEFNIQGPVINVVAACATGANSIIIGSRWINQGLCDIVLAGATESSINDLYLAGFNNMGVLAKISNTPKTNPKGRALKDERVTELQRGNGAYQGIYKKASTSPPECFASCMRPFDAKRSGFIIGEGAGIVVLESREHATKRGAAKLYGEIAGHAMGLDPNHIVHFNSDGSHIGRVMKKAIDSSGLSSGFVDYLNAHGTATKLNDYLEAMAIKRTFGENASAVSVSSTKAATGHLLGAGGSVEFIFCLLAMRDNIAPPTLNLEEPDPNLGLDLTPRVARHKEIKTAMSVSFGFGGHIAAIVAKEIQSSKCKV